MHDILWIILGMGLVTYGPRLIPFLALTGRDLPSGIRAFLSAIPVAALGALIIPGVLDATPGHPFAALAGIGFTVAYGFIRGGMIVPVLGSVVITYLVLTFSA